MAFKAIRRVSVFSKAYKIKSRRTLLITSLLILTIVLYNCEWFPNELVLRNSKIWTLNRSSYSHITKTQLEYEILEQFNGTKTPEEIVLVMALCGRSDKKFNELLVLFKSAIMLQFSAKLKFILLCEQALQSEVDRQLQQMKSLSNASWTYQILDTAFPENRVKDLRNWEKILNLPCTTQRLYLPNILRNERKILYVDTDVIFMNALPTVWRTFEFMNPSQLLAAVLETENPEVGWYPRIARKRHYPVYGKSGLNAGVLFMDLEKIRKTKWDEEIDAILMQYKSRIKGCIDQDVINIYSLNNPDRLYLSSCTNNYRKVHCAKINDCPEIETNGVSILHGWAGAFHKNYQPWSVFYTIYQQFIQYELGTDPYHNLMEPLEDKIKNMREEGNCVKSYPGLLKNLKKLFPKSA